VGDVTGAWLVREQKADFAVHAASEITPAAQGKRAEVHPSGIGCADVFEYVPGGGLTYVWRGDCTNYLFALIAGFDKEIPEDHFGAHCRSDEASAVLGHAVLVRFGDRVPDGHTLILWIDHETQFRTQKFCETAKQLNVKLEYAGIQCPDDKPYIEAFFSKYKVEEVYRNEYRNSAEAKAGWELYRSWYETERVHQSLDC
jgi:transposase InsO family protein